MDRYNEELNPWGEDTALPMETLNDIAKMLNRLAYSGKCTQKEDGFFSSSSNCLATWVSCLADRIKAAAERERIQRDKVSFRCGDCARFGGDCDAGDSDGNDDRIACEKFVRRAIVPGNAAALRDALESTEELLEHFAKPGTMLHNAFFLHMRDNRTALAAPIRNCDVGTAEEQERRYFKLKTEFIDRITKCPHVGYSYFPESLEWAQMPYEAEGGHGVK